MSRSSGGEKVEFVEKCLTKILPFLERRNYLAARDERDKNRLSEILAKILDKRFKQFWDIGTEDNIVSEIV